MDAIRTSPAIRRGFTLVEMVVSAAIMGVLAVGISSAVLVSTRAVENQDSQVIRTLAAADVSGQMNMEMSTAVNVSEAAPNAVTFDVPDRDGDGESETIRYYWSGIVGDPLNRALNSEPVFAILNDVRTFALNYQNVQIIKTSSSNDFFLAGHNATSHLSTFKPSNNNWICQSFIANLPAGATGWRVSRISVYGRINGTANGQVTIELRDALSNGLPGSTLICQAIAPESEFATSSAWHSIAFPSASCTAGYLATNQVACLLIKGNMSDSCSLTYHNRNVSLSNNKYAYTTSAGGSWTVKTNQAILFEVYGKVAGINGSGGGTTHLSAVRWQIAAGDDAASQIDAGVQIPNLPEAPQ